MMSTILENRFIENLTRSFPRSPIQLNQLQESDAEVIRLSADSGREIAVTTDSIAEEITAGLYEDPYLAGWMIVMVNMSDIAAVGAEPLGVLISQTLPHDFADTLLRRLQMGISDACEACGTYVLGGDTNFDNHLMLSGCGLGCFSQKPHLSRMGSQPGDLLYTTDVLGSGNAYALVQIMRALDKNIDFKPVARLKHGRSLCGIATACIDTSDGVIAALDQLMRLNNVGFALDHDWERCLHPDARAIVETRGVPAWLLLAGHHGEFELLFTVPPGREAMLLAAAERHGWRPRGLGRVIPEPVLRMPLYGTIASLDTARVRNLAFSATDNVRLYVQELLHLDDELRKGALIHADE